MENNEKGTETLTEEKARLKDESDFRRVVLSQLSKEEKNNRTKKDIRFKENAERIKSTGLLDSKNALANKISSDLLGMAENANKLSLKELDLQKKQLRNIEKTLIGVNDPVEKNKLQELIDLSRADLKNSTLLSTKIGDVVASSLVNSTAILSGVLAESPILGIGVKLAGDALAEKIQSRRDQKTELADQTKSLREAFEDSSPAEVSGESGVSTDDNLYTNKNAEENFEDLIERVDMSKVSEEERREAKVRADKDTELLERQTEALEGLGDEINSQSSEESGVGLGGALALGAASIGLSLMAAMKGAMMVFSGALKTFVVKTVPSFLLRINPIAMIGGVLFTGIFDAFEEYKKSGIISNTIASGLGGILDFFTFGFINKESVEAFLNPKFDMIKEAMSAPLESLQTLWSTVGSFFDDINANIVDTFNINPREIFQESLDTIVSNIQEMLMFLIELPGKMLESLTGIGKGLSEEIGSFFSDMNPFSEVELATPNNTEMSALETPRKEAILSNLISQSNQPLVSSPRNDIPTTPVNEESNIAVSAPVTNNVVSNKTTYNTLRADSAKRIITD